MADLKDKQTAGKLRLDLLPIRAIEQVAAAFQWSVDNGKYEPWAWLHVDDWQDKYFAAAMRHLFAARKGEVKDKESGLHPFAHAAADVLILLARTIGEQR